MYGDFEEKPFGLGLRRTLLMMICSSVIYAKLSQWWCKDDFGTQSELTAMHKAPQSRTETNAKFTMHMTKGSLWL